MNDERRKLDERLGKNKKHLKREISTDTKEEYNTGERKKKKKKKKRRKEEKRVKIEDYLSP